MKWVCPSVRPTTFAVCTHFIRGQTARRDPHARAQEKKQHCGARGGSTGAAIECGKSRSETMIIGLSRLVTRVMVIDEMRGGGGVHAGDYSHSWRTIGSSAKCPTDRFALYYLFGCLSHRHSHMPIDRLNGGLLGRRQQLGSCDCSRRAVTSSKVL